MANPGRGRSRASQGPSDLPADVVHAFLAHRADAAPRLAAAAAANPGSLPALLARGFAAMLTARQDARLVARGVLAEAGTLPDQATGDRPLVEALGCWADGDMHGAAARIDAVLAVRPRDAFLLKVSHLLRFMLGDAIEMHRALDRALQGWPADHPHYGYLLGCHAFALEELGAYAEAEYRGREACERNADDVWAAHAVAHVHEMRDQPELGLIWLDAQARRLEGCSNFGQHVHWHRALYLLELGRPEAAIAIYDGSIGPAMTDDYRDFANAASLLWRLDAAGVSPGARWDSLADWVSGRWDAYDLVFAVLHVLLVFIGARRPAEVQRVLGRLAASAAAGRSTQDRVAAEAGLPAARGVAALADAPREACSRLDVAAARLRSIGGSNAQRAVFALCQAQAAIRLGDPQQLGRLSSSWDDVRPPRRWMRDRMLASPPDNRAL